jgi:hypothetical protein
MRARKRHLHPAGPIDDLRVQAGPPAAFGESLLKGAHIGIRGACHENSVRLFRVVRQMEKIIIGTTRALAFLRSELFEQNGVKHSAAANCKAL